jgi:hypothetical protein
VGGQPLEPEELGEAVGVAFFTLQLLQHPQLTLHKGLTAPGQVDHDVVDFSPRDRALFRVRRWRIEPPRAHPAQHDRRPFGSPSRRPTVPG